MITGRGIDDVRRLGRRLTTFGVVHSIWMKSKLYSIMAATQKV